MIRSLFLFTGMAGLLATGCCEHKCCLNKPDCRPKPYQPSAPNGPILLPPANLPTTPGAPVSPGPLVPSVGPAYYPPPVLPSTPSFKPAPEVLFPDPLPGGTSSRGIAPMDRGLGIRQNPAKAQATPEPPLVPSTMTGLPGYTKLPNDLASGRKPDLDGFATLKQAGYRTVIYLYSAGTDVSATRDLAGKRGLAFVSIETTPENLTTALEAFNSTISDKAVRPAYVFDDDGVRAGALWYLHFRSLNLNDDAARVMAKPLGLTDRGAEAVAFELATQKYLANR